MAIPLLIAQGLNEQKHCDVINQMLGSNGNSEVIISVAFALEDGVSCISDHLIRLGSTTSVFVGIRNDITSAQALLNLLSTGAKIYAVDTATQSILFHPKIYFASQGTLHQSLLGSANLTFSGLNNNIEASTHLSLSDEDPHDKQYSSSITDLFLSLPDRFPDHVFQIQSARQIVQLLREGRVSDERARIVFDQKATTKSRTREILSRIPLPISRKPRRRRRRRPSRTIIHSRDTAFAGDYDLVWTSKPMKERDLNVPTGSKTNPTGSMLFKKGLNEDIDQRHYFRDEVFNSLIWRPDTNRPHLLRSECQFAIIIKGVNYGAFELKISHNTDTTSASYIQRNSMTQIHWGDARPLIAKRDLLGSQIRLFRSQTNQTRFVMQFVDPESLVEGE